MTENKQPNALERSKDEELENYRREKQEEAEAAHQPAQAEHDPEWESKDHIDIERNSQRPSRSGETKDAEGQAERGSIDQIITDDGYTQTR